MGPVFFFFFHSSGLTPVVFHPRGATQALAATPGTQAVRATAATQAVAATAGTRARRRTPQTTTE